MSNYTYHGTRDLIVLPGRSVQTFPSGLVRVDRTYACRAADAGRFRQQFAVGNPLPFDDGTPAIDGIYIGSEPNETLGDDGFARFKTSAYGRTNTTGKIVEGTESNSLIQTIVIPASVRRVDIAPPIAPRTVISYTRTFLTQPSVPPGQEGFYLVEARTTFFYSIRGIDRVNFTFWDECKITWVELRSSEFSRSRIF